MKNVLKYLILLATITNAKAQTADRLSADLLGESRFKFNKRLIREEVKNIHELPCSRYLFRQSEGCEVDIEGLIFETGYNSITGIKGIEVPTEALRQINDRLGMLDRLQWAYSEASNNQYRSGERNNYEIVFNDRRFFATLAAIKSTARDIKKIYGSGLSSSAKSEAIAKLRFANIDFKFYGQLLDADNCQISASARKR